ncbi:MAG: hypothetical protein LBU64_00060, partial [Planctomycetota bacterium]|nr:hypothetical protein [Planctomycetota bacterium]
MNMDSLEDRGGAKRRLAVFLALAAAGLFLYLAVPPGDRRANPFPSRLTFSFPSYVEAVSGGGLTVVDSSRRRIVRLDRGGDLLRLIEGGSRDPGRFFHAQETATSPDGRLFVLNWLPDADGFYLEREEIQEYDSSGDFVRTVHRVDLEPERRSGYRAALRPMSRALGLDGENRPRWLELLPEGLLAWSAEPDPATGGWRARPGRLFPLAGAHLAVAEAVFTPDGGIAYTHKAGRIYRQAGPESGPELLYDADASGRLTPDGVPSMPWGLAADRRGGLIFTDLVFREIRSLPAAGPAATLFSADDLSERYPPFRRDIEARGIKPAGTYFARLSSNTEGTIGTSCENTLVTLSDDGAAADFRHDLSARPSRRLAAAASWLALAVMAAGLILAVRSFHAKVLGRRLPAGLLRALGILTIMALTLGVTMPIMVDNMFERERQAQERQLRQMLETLPFMIDAEAIRGLNRAGDFRNQAYEGLRERLLRVFFETGDEWNRGYYYALYRFRDGRPYALMYSNDEVGLYYPFSWEDESLYRDAQERGLATVSTSSDAYGDWVFGVAPIRDAAGEVAAVLEIGRDFYVFN